MISDKKTCNLIFWCCSFHERKAKKKEKERKKETKNKEPKESKNKDKKEERKKRRKKRDWERETEKEGGPKGLREKERETLTIKNALFWGKNKVFFCIKQPKKENQKKKQNKKTTKTNKEGLGPSEVALWATSPDP